MELRAETAYNIAMALPQPELQRLLSMLEQFQKPQAAAKPKKQSTIWTIPECTEALLKHLHDYKRKKRLRQLG